MDIHKNARLTFVRREQLAEKVILQGSTLNSAAAEFNVCAAPPPSGRGAFGNKGRLVYPTVLLVRCGPHAARPTP
jgi:hypothetical protein